MKVYLGKYTSWFGPYQLASALCFWAKNTKDKYGIESEPDWVHKFGEFLAHGNVEDEEHLPSNRRKHKERPITWLYRFLKWIDSKKKRTIKVRIDPWDIWSFHSSLALIILPGLKMLKEVKHGAPSVDDEDVPAELRSNNKPADNEYEPDGLWFKRYDWILDEMIWTFEQLQPDYDWEEQYATGETDFYTEKLENGMYRLQHGPNHTYKVDEEARARHQERIDNGLRLFGKYYYSLAD